MLHPHVMICGATSVNVACFPTPDRYHKKHLIVIIAPLMNSQKNTRSRLSPEARKEQILDVAAQLIRENGVSAMNMDRLGREAGVSKPLVYNYFPNRIDLLKSLLLREVKKYHVDSASIAQSSSTLEALVRATSRNMLDYVQKSGIVIQQLMLEPEVADVLQELDSRFHRKYSDYLTKRIQNEYGITRDVAAAVVEIALGLSSAAGAYLERTKTDTDFVEDLLTAMIMGSFERSAARAKAGKVRLPKRLRAVAKPN
jgi:TetR/AcrR family transcriptional regulator, fatty acid biosynthesis regulator